VGDVSIIASSCGDVVISLVPPGVDIHEYQLTSRDLELLRTANLVVSTGHTSFELKIKELAERGELNVTVLDVLEIPGLKPSVNPVTNQLNYHMPVKDPVNYLLFTSRLTRVLAELNPSKAECYYSNYFRVLDEVYSKILVYRDEYNGLVVVDTPHAQYYVEWMGFNVAWILKYEEEVPVTAESLEKVRELLSSGHVKLLVVTEGFPGEALLVEEAGKYGVPVIVVPHPSSDTSVLEGLHRVVSQLEELRLERDRSAGISAVKREDYTSVLYVTLAFTSGVVVGVILSELYKRWRVWRLR